MDVERMLLDSDLGVRIARGLAEAPPIEQKLPAQVALVLLGELQLVLRHPSNADRSRYTTAVTLEAAQQLQAALERRVPELAPIIAAGWDPEEDR